MALDEIRDQPRAVALLSRALESGRVAHAYAFVGPAGSGRMTTARAFAAALLGRRVLHHPDLHVIAPTPPETNPKGTRAIRIGAIRELERQAALRPLLAPRKVFILDEAERMTDEAPQAFLKTLEEPPAATVMVLILPRIRAVPATVLSRCQIVRFAPRGDAAAAPLRARAQAILDEARAQGPAEMLRGTEGMDRETVEGLVDAYTLFCRDLLVAGAEAPAHLLLDGSRAEALAREAATWSQDEILLTLAICRQARVGLAHNVAPRLTLEIVLSRLARRAA